MDWRDRTGARPAPCPRSPHSSLRRQRLRVELVRFPGRLAGPPRGKALHQVFWVRWCVSSASPGGPLNATMLVRDGRLSGSSALRRVTHARKNSMRSFTTRVDHQLCRCKRRGDPCRPLAHRRAQSPCSIPARRRSASPTIRPVPRRQAPRSDRRRRWRAWRRAG